MAPFGRMVSFGAAAGSPAEISSMALMEENLPVTGYSLMGSMRRPDRVARAVQELTRFLADDRLKVTIGQTYPLGRAADAHRAIAERRTVGKTVLTTAAD